MNGADAGAPDGASRRPGDYPSELERTWLAPDGTPVKIRALRPDDLQRELEFARALSRQSLYLRLHYSPREVTVRDAERLLELDYHDTLAVGALVAGDHDDRIVGVSRYARIDASDRAECAIVVADEWQGQGLGTELMRSLADAAKARGIVTLEGTSLAENRRILAWARNFGIGARTESADGGMARVILELDSLPG
ncbi:MAG TPA: GNAT family N-acetyltransferase [Steroidobacteraceae bacterium]|nr:GNAT family N-acetyltransferase [Steroidobacteraceae bacterium]